MLSRRGFVLAGGALAVAGAGLAGCSDKVRKAIGLGERMVEIEKRQGGRMGVSAVIGTTAVNGGMNIDSDQRFAMCSTFKWVLATAILQQADQGKLKLSQAVKYGQKDLLDNAPVTKANVAKGQMSVADLCAATIEQSDNTAANLLYPLIGGPAGLTAFVRGLGDTTTRFDRTEPDLNSNVDKDDRDTTTPRAMSELLQKVYTGDVLKTDSLAQLKAWMIACATGTKRIRASLPVGWTAGDKTGTGANGAANDVAVIWPDNGSPIFMTIFTTGGTLDADGRDKVIADTAKVVFDTIGFAQSLDSEAASDSDSESPAASIS